MRTIDKIITDVSCKYGAPMGRLSFGKPNGKKVFDRAVPMIGAYDKGGAYWGIPSNEKGCGQLRVKYTKDLQYIKFYRV
jgi:hypothetical protein